MSNNKITIYNLNETITIPETGANALHYWASIDDIESIKKIKNLHVLLLRDFQGNTALHYATNNNCLEVCKFYVEQFPGQEFQNIRKISPGHLAAQKGNVEILKLFRKSNTLLYDISQKGWYPLHFSIYYGQYEAVKYLIENKINFIDKLILGSEIPTNLRMKFLSPYDLAEIIKNEDILNLLKNYGALPSLHSAVLSRNLLEITYLVESPFSNMKDIDLKAGNRESTALHIAASKGFYEICHYLILSKASIYSLDRDGLSPLEVAITSNSAKTVLTIKAFSTHEQILKAAFLSADLGNEQISSELIKTNFETIVNQEKNDSLLIRLIKRNNFKPALELLTHKNQNDIKFKDNRGANALHYASACSSLPLLKELLSIFKSDRNEKDNLGLTPLMYGVLSGNNSTINLLNSDNEITCNCGLSALGLSIIMKKPEILLTQNLKHFKLKYIIDFNQLLELFKKHNLPNKFIEIANHRHLCPKLNLLDSEFPKAIIEILQKFKDQIVENVTLLHLASITIDDPTIFNKILEINHEWLNETDSFGRIPLHYAILSNNLITSELLIKEMKHLNQIDQKGNTIFHYFTSDLMLPLARKILKNSSFNLTEINEFGQNPFHLLCLNGTSLILKHFLLTLDINNRYCLNVLDKFNKTPLSYAFENHHKECVSLLHSYDVENQLNYYINLNDFENIQRLIEFGYPINSNDKDGMTALHFAAIKGNQLIIQYLINKGANVHAHNNKGLDPIHYASKSNNLEVIKVLLSVDYKIHEIKSQNQPYLLCTDQKCKEFLFHYWKRQYYYLQIIDLIKKRNESLLILNNFCLQFKDNNLFKEIIEVSNRIVFINNNILSRIKQSNSYPNTRSLHHFLLIFNTLNIYDYSKRILNYHSKFFEITTNVSPFNKPMNGMISKQTSLLMNYLILFYPLHYVIHLSFLITELCKHLINEIDNIEIMNSILFNINEQKTQADYTFKELQNEITTQIIQKCDISIYNNFNNGVLYVATCKITNLRYKTRHVFQNQFHQTFKNFFGEMFNMTRLIPFNKSQWLRVVLCNDFMILSAIEKNSENFISFPYPLIFINDLGNYKGYRIFTPAGKFELTLDKEDSLFQHLINSRILQLTNSNVGQIHFQKNKDKIFQCLVTYSDDQEFLNTKIILVRAGDKSECEDICYNHLLEVVSSSINFYTVLTRDITNSIDDLIII